MTALLAFVAVGHLAWLAADGAMTGYDERAFVEHFVKYRDLWSDGTLAQRFGWLGFSSYPAWPFLSGMMTTAAAGDSLFALRLNSVLFHLLWILAAFGVARRLDRPLAGLVAAAVVALSPSVTLLARHYGSFLPHAAMSTVAVCVLLRTRGANGWGGALLGGLACAWAFLSERGTPVLFLAGPLMFVFLWRWLGWQVGAASEKSGVDRVGLVRDIAVFAVVVALLAGPYLIGFIKTNLGQTAFMYTQSVVEARSWTYYLARIRGGLITHAFFPLALVGIGYGIFRRDRRLLLPLLWAAIPVAVLSFAASKDMVYALSLTTPLAVLAGMGTAYLPRGRWRAPVVLFMLIFACLTFVRAGNPDGDLAKRFAHIRFFTLHDPLHTPSDPPKQGLEYNKLIAAVQALQPGPGDIWAVTGRSLAPDDPRTRFNLGNDIRLTMQLRRVPGRYLIAYENLFPDRLSARGIDQHLVLVPDALTPSGSAAARLARPAFDPREHRRDEGKVVEQWRDLQLQRIHVTGLGTVRLILWRALPNPLPPAVPASAAVQSDPTAGETAP